MFFEPTELLKLSPSGPTNSLASFIYKKLNTHFKINWRLIRLISKGFLCKKFKIHNEYVKNILFIFI